jgi:hypothetical protein
MLVLCLPLLLGAGIGMPMRPEEIEELIHNTNQQAIACTIAANKQKEAEMISMEKEGEI